jgi:hypothetical protein
MPVENKPKSTAPVKNTSKEAPDGRWTAGCAQAVMSGKKAARNCRTHVSFLREFGIFHAII